MFLKKHVVYLLSIIEDIERTKNASLVQKHELINCLLRGAPFKILMFTAILRQSK